jgi:CRISPR-associated exonuclease Cas4
MEPAKFFIEDELLPLSALQHLAFCERQWALIHLEQVWAENRLTAEGNLLHARVHETDTESRSEIVTARGLPLRSLRLGLSGQSDVVEFHRAPPDAPPGSATPLPDRPGLWRPIPIEYKRGRAKRNDHDRVQLCAQALCLEEMFSVSIPAAALFYATPRRRTVIDLSPALRSRTESLAARMHALHRNGSTPPPIYSKGCESCSLREICLPKALASRPSVAAYLASAFQEA